MNPDTAELAIADSASEPTRPPRRRPPLLRARRRPPAPAVPPRLRACCGCSPAPTRESLVALSQAAERSAAGATTSLRSAPGGDPGAGSARAAALRDSWRALWSSRLLVWVAGAGTLLTYGYGPVRHAFNPPGLTRGFGWLGNLLAAPAARWDASWYLVIAHYGYRPDLGAFTSSRDAFFPLYPLGLRAFATIGVPLVLGGVLLSLAALALALYGIHRLTTLELASARRMSAPAAAASAQPAGAASAPGGLDGVATSLAWP